MLVLSRRTQQEILFPNLGVKLQILQVRGRIVKIGIEAPQTVDVVRPESSKHTPSESQSEPDGETEHRLRNELNLLQLRIAVLQSRLDAGERIDAESTLDSLISGVDSIDRALAPVSKPERPRKPRKLLVVEDCDNERKLMAYTLACHGFDVHVSRDGAEAIEMLRSQQKLPDVVLLDLQMPTFNGLETLCQIRDDERLRNLTVVAVTGSRRVPESEPVGRGWDGWFSKPLDVAQLVNFIQKVPAASLVCSAMADE